MKPIDCLLALAIICASTGAASAVDVAPAGASACSGCHPISRSVETPFTRLVGRNPADILTDRIAKGFTDDEIKAIAAWYAAQKD
jgi:sulfide dehydrogenase cytochrome subunit